MNREERMENRMNLRERILEAAIDIINEKSYKFTMDEVAKRIEISKKTIYTVFPDKESLFLETVDYCFLKIKESERQIIENPDLDIVEKIRKVLIVLPGRFEGLDFRQIYKLKEKAPRIYQKIEKRIENEWEPSIALIEEGIKLGKIKPMTIVILKTMIEASMEHFIGNRVLIENEISYAEALDKMMDIIMQGIVC